MVARPADHAPCTVPPHGARRRVLRAALRWATLTTGHGVASGGVAASLAALAGCASTPSAKAHAIVAVAPGVWMLPGAPGEADADTGARTGNAGVIEGPRGALVIDSGVSHAHGLERLAAIRGVTRQPIRALLLTHARQEFLFGATAFQAQGVPVWMHEHAARLMAARCETCLKTLTRLLGSAAMAGTRVPKPDHLFADTGGTAGTTPTATLQAQLSEAIGRPLRLLVPGPRGHAASPGNSAVLDETSGTLFAGALADADSIPDIQDADVPAWRQALTDLIDPRAPPPRRVVPGHGPLAGPEVLEADARYLVELHARIAALLRAGTPLSDVSDAATLPAFAPWALYDTTHRRNASIVYLRQEREQLLNDRR